jgi:hypothetical protein
MESEKTYGSARFRWSEFEDFFTDFKTTLCDAEQVHLTNVLREAFERRFKKRCLNIPPWLKKDE